MKRFFAVGGLILALAHYLFWAGLPLIVTMYLHNYKYLERWIHGLKHR